MIYAHYKTPNGETVSSLFYDWQTLTRATWNPETEIYSIINFCIRGKDYRSRQADLINTACKWQYESAPGISWSEAADVADWFYTNARRYGLIEEFRENGII